MGKSVKSTLISTRLFKTDYAGAWCGHSKTREGAIIAAVRHLVLDGYTTAVISSKFTGIEVCRIRLSSDRKRAVVETIKPLKKIGM